MYETWLANPGTSLTPLPPQPPVTPAPIDYDCFASAIAHGLPVPPDATAIATIVAHTTYSD